MNNPENKYKYLVKREKECFSKVFTLSEIESGVCLAWLTANNVKPEELHRLKFTGILDGYGNEIYEGDIILNENWWWGACYVYLSRGNVGPCRGDSIMEYILAKNIDNPMVDAVGNLWDGNKVEIIGDIFSSPELIGKISEKVKRHNKEKEEGHRAFGEAIENEIIDFPQWLQEAMPDIKFSTVTMDKTHTEQLAICTVEGHDWNVEIGVDSNNGGKCSLLTFICQRCKVKAHRALHDYSHKQIQKLIKLALEQGK